jgi:GTPase Era involved in 16S rRNA processing
MSRKDNLTKSEIKQAKQNGFIISGKTGAGKTTLLNALFGQEKGVAKRSSEAVTQKSTIYYYKLENGKCISLVDTPGLSDTRKTNKPDIDNIHLNQIQLVISQSNVHIKGILFLVNFQNERFDSDEQEALLKYNQLFPLKRFWKNIIIIFTHYYHDPDGDNEEEMKEARDKSNGEIFTKLMDQVKDVSDVIDYKDLNTKYFNSFSPIKKPSQEQKNKLVRNELEIELDKLISYPPLFSKIEIITISNFKIKEKENNKKFLAEIEVIGFFDLNNEPLNEKVKLLTKKEVSEEEYNNTKQKASIKVCRAIKNKLGNLNYVIEDGNEKNSIYARLGHGLLGGAIAGGLGLGIAGVAAGVAGIAALPVVGVGAGIAAGIGAIIGFFKD